MYKTEDFFERYKELEAWATANYEDGVYGLEQSHHDKKVQSEITYFRKVRNLLAHNRNGLDKPLIELTDEFRDKFDALCNKLMDSISQIAVPYKDIYKREMSDKVLPTIATMKERTFSHVPVMNGKKVWGVFSESAIFDIVSDGSMSLIQDDTQFFKIGKYITEYSQSGIFDFMHSNTSIDNIRRAFIDAFDEGRKLDVIFITTTGDKNGDLKELVTIWDVLSA